MKPKHSMEPARETPGLAPARGRLDALLPREMAARAELIGVDKARLDAGRLVALAVLAGAFIGFGSILSLVAVAGADGVLPYGATRVLGGLAFSLGLILVIVGGAELFTGNNLMIMAHASGKIGTTELLRAWSFVYLGNLLGSVALAVLVFLAAGYDHGRGAVGLAALAGAEAKLSLSAAQALINGILANLLVCLAVWLSYSARTTADKILAIVPPVVGFVAAGFEHSIANMYLLAFALLVKSAAPAGFWESIGQGPAAFPHIVWLPAAANLFWVTIGNVIGGVIVGLTYWYIYLRTTGRPPGARAGRQ
jgi:formate/nitrite transporter